MLPSGHLDDATGQLHHLRSVVVRRRAWHCHSSLVNTHSLYTSSAVEHFTGVWYVKNALLFASFPCFGIDLPIIGIAQVDAPTAFLWNSGSQSNRDARRLDAECLVVGSRSLDVRAMRQYASRYMFEAIPLLDEIILDMVADLVNQFTVCVGDLSDIRGVDNHFASIGNRRFGFVHRLGCRPQVVVHFGWGREYPVKRAVYIGDVELCREICCMTPRFKVVADVETMQLRALHHHRQAEERTCHKSCRLCNDAPDRGILHTDGTHAGH